VKAGLIEDDERRADDDRHRESLIILVDRAVGIRSRHAAIGGRDRLNARRRATARRETGSCAHAAEPSRQQYPDDVIVCVGRRTPSVRLTGDGTAEDSASRNGSAACRKHIHGSPR
jgi:hypothetical protein